MKHFASALVAATAAAGSLEFPIQVDGSQKVVTLTSEDWSSAQYNGQELSINNNNYLFMRDSSNRMFSPLIRGGSVSYDVDVSSQNSGCVAGVYLVHTDNGACGEVDQAGQAPNCKSIDMMQANKHGFETKAHPCSNGTCDAVSQCIAGMQQQGIEEYGVDAYGPGGRLIDTNSKFNVLNEFISTQDYQKFWKIKTTLKQAGNEIVLENDCRDYLVGINDPIEGDMGFVLSSWDNTNGAESFELDQGQNRADTCDDATNIISRFSVKQYGSRQEMSEDTSDAEEGFLKYSITVNGAEKSKFLSVEPWTNASTNANSLELGGNSSVFLRDEESMSASDAYTPLVRGGSIMYDVNLSMQESGCVAGVYLLDANDSNCGQVDQNGSIPQCKSIDAMQANLFGFESKAHPCSNGTCDAMSQCIVGMQKQGAEKYGADAYGPSGSIINTSYEFKVLNEFVSTPDYQQFWKLRTTLSQGNNSMMMEADCRDYLVGLNDSIEGDMSFVFANWDNTSGSEQFELDYGQSTASTCENSWAVIKNFSVMEYGSNENMPPAPEPQPEPTNDPLPFVTNSSVYGGDYEMWLKGIAGQCLETEGSTVEMGQNNRAWLNDEPDREDSAELAYYHNYLGGSMEYDVDLSQVDCACASGMYLVDTTNEECGPQAKDSEERPQCSRVEIMEANISGFSTASYPCEFGVCASPKSRQNTDMDQYGPSDLFTINTSEPFKVNTRFFALQEADGTMGDLMKIETCLIQADRMVTLLQDDEDYLYVLSDLLKSKMAMVLSNYDAGEVNEINDGQCSSTCGEYKSKMSNFKFTEGDSIFVPEPEDEMVIGELADNIDDCEDDFCSKCNVAWWAGDEMETFNTCTDYTRYRYTNKCSSWQSDALCGDDDLCFKSYPISDPEKWKSDDYACRPLPDRMSEASDLAWSSRVQNKRKGLCGLNGCDSTCHMSWPIADPEKWKSADAMVRCKN